MGARPRYFSRRISTIRHGLRLRLIGLVRLGLRFGGGVLGGGAGARYEPGCASAIARSVSGSRLVYVSAVMVIEERPSISWMSFRSAPAAWARVAAPWRRSWSWTRGRPISS
ncbi:hypothetical protein ADK35_30385 [Streptomyces viridochromogenes]|nr:hypothetical protein ADK36_30740 [Streptomyces viridochromogenes]KOG15117.1 hypothetical protein ADK35_30385 [Streptomyces viridochromogenes]